MPAATRPAKSASGIKPQGFAARLIPYYGDGGICLEARPGIEPGCADLQSAASPLRHRAGERARIASLCRESQPKVAPKMTVAAYWATSPDCRAKDAVSTNSPESILAHGASQARSDKISTIVYCIHNTEVAWTTDYSLQGSTLGPGKFQTNAQSDGCQPVAHDRGQRPAPDRRDEPHPARGFCPSSPAQLCLC